MREDIKNKWVYFLKSSKYKKTTGQLRKSKGDECAYCALGVLTDLYIKANSDTCSWNKDYPVINGQKYECDVLPKPVADWAELTYCNGKIKDRQIRSTILDLNDTGSSFEEIATIIETEGLV